MAESIASPRRVSMTGSITWNSKKQGVDDYLVYELLKKNQMEAVIVDYWKRIPKESFQNWYKSQSRYRTKEDREKAALLEDATITMPEMAQLLVQRILSKRYIDLSDFSYAALSSIAVATATPHSSALHMRKSSCVNIADT